MSAGSWPAALASGAATCGMRSPDNEGVLASRRLVPHIDAALLAGKGQAGRPASKGGRAGLATCGSFADARSARQKSPAQLV